MLGRDSHLVPTLSRIPILRFMSPGATRERIPPKVGARRDSRTSRILLVLFRRPAVDARSPVLASEAEGFFQPVDVDEVVQRRKSQLRRLLG